MAAKLEMQPKTKLSRTLATKKFGLYPQEKH
jgi:hypothetical protein